MSDSDKHNNNRVIIMAMVSIVALIGIFSAGQNITTSGSAIKSPIIQCNDEPYCLNWEWINETMLNCARIEFIDYEVCSGYSWPVNKEGEFEMQCDSWDLISKNECQEWEFEVEWKRDCTDWTVRRDCYALIE